MRFFHYGKDGGPESTVWGFFLVELKSLFSIVLLRFENGSRDAYHGHAFDAVSWLLRGQLAEQFPFPDSRPVDGVWHEPSWCPIVTRRENIHRVTSIGRSWVLSFRGPWAKTWPEVLPDGTRVDLTHGRRPVR